MNDDKAQSKSEESEVKSEKQIDDDISNDGDQMIPKARLDKVIEQREKALEELSTVKEEIESLKSMKDEIAELRNQVSNKNEKSNDEIFTREEEDALSKIDKGLRERGYLTKTEFEEAKRIDNRNSKINELSGKYTKGSGYPIFKAEEVLVYAKKNGFGDNLEAAYRDLHWDAIAQIIAKRQGTGLEPVDSEKPIGGERQKGTETTTADVAEMDLNEYAKSRDTIMGKFRKSIFGK